MRNVDIKITGMKRKRRNGQSHQSLPGNEIKPLMIADLQFLFRLFRQYPDPFPEGMCPVMHLPDVLLHGLPPNLLVKLKHWQKSGAVSIIKTGDTLFDTAAGYSVNPGMQITDYIALLTAKTRKQTIIASTAIIIHEASRLKVPVTRGNELLQRLSEGTAMEMMPQKRIRKNKIIPVGVPALIAGNNQKVK